MRILSLQPSISLILQSLGRLDTLAGCTRYCLDVIPELRPLRLPMVRDSWSSETGEIVALKPDLELASVPYRQESLAVILRAGLPVLALAPHSLNDIYGDIQLIGSIVNEPARAGEVVGRMRDAECEATRVASHSERRPLVYCEEWASRSSTRSRGCESLSRPRAASLWAKRGRSPTRRQSPPPILR
jgi:iron complex transport system substrate-binding protein